MKILSVPALRLLSTVLALLLAWPASGEIYKLVQPSGKVEYTDLPKTNSVPVSPVKKPLVRAEAPLPGVQEDKVGSGGMGNPFPLSKPARAAASGATVKWHPGHYVLVYMSTDLSSSPVISEIAGNGLLRGVQKRYTWTALEPSKNQYDFSEIKRDLDILRGIGKRLVVQIQTKSFEDVDIYVPAYLRTATYGSGIFHMSSGGYNLTLWNTALKDRFVALVRALGKSLNGDDALEAVNLNESTVGVPATPVPSGYDETKFIDNLLLVDSALKESFPAKVVIQYVNYPKAQLPKMTSHLKTNGIGMGGPDVLLEDPGLSTGAYLYYPQMAGVVPIGVAVQWEDYTARYHGGPFNPPPVASIYAYAKDNLKTNYLFWMRRLPSENNATNYWQQVLDLLASPVVPKDAAGGLAKTCPTVFSACVE